MEETPTSTAAPAISSFVIRFVHPDTIGQPAGQMAGQLASQPDRLSYRGTILHVQTNQEVAFTRWEDAVTFIRRFVPLDAAGLVDPP